MRYKFFIVNLIFAPGIRSECPYGWVENVENKKCYGAYESGHEARV